MLVSFFSFFITLNRQKIYPFLGSEFSNTLNLQVKLKTTVDSIGDLVDNLIYSFKSKSLKVSPSFEAELISLQFCCIMIRVHVMWGRYFSLQSYHSKIVACIILPSLSSRLYLIVYEMVFAPVHLCIDQHDHRQTQYTVNVYLPRDFTQ